MKIGVPKETLPGERRVALVPETVQKLTKQGNEVVVERGAGTEAAFVDGAYEQAGARIVEDAFAADLVVKVQRPTPAEIGKLRQGQLLIGFLQPLIDPRYAQTLAERGVTALSMDSIPRITRAQPMDALSSQATVAGYKAVLLAADALPRFFPMLTTAAGTIAPAKAFVIGAGVAGLQAIATARRLGAVVQAFDTRPVVREQVESLGAKFVAMPLATGDAEGAGGYAKQLDEEFYRRQRELMAQTVAASDVCITTAAIPGKKSPVLVTADAVRGMAPGSVIVDLAAERGGNCELTRPDETVVENGVTIFGPTNLPSEVPNHASQMYAKNLTNFVALVTRDGKPHLNLEDQVVRETLATHRGEVVNPRLRELLNLPPLATPQPGSPPVDHLASK